MNLLCPICGSNWEEECPEEFCIEANKVPCNNCINNSSEDILYPYLIEIRENLITLYER